MCVNWPQAEIAASLVLFVIWAFFGYRLCMRNSRSVWDWLLWGELIMAADLLITMGTLGGK